MRSKYEYVAIDQNFVEELISKYLNLDVLHNLKHTTFGGRPLNLWVKSIRTDSLQVNEHK